MSVLYNGIYTSQGYIFTFKLTLCVFSINDLKFQNHFYNLLPSNRENVTLAIDTAYPGDLASDYITLVACPGPSCNKLPYSPTEGQGGALFQ